MAWELLGSEKLGSANATITVDSLTQKRYLLVLVFTHNTSTMWCEMTMNNDGGANYATRRNLNHQADTTQTGQTVMKIGENSVADAQTWVSVYVDNDPNGQKTITAYCCDQSNSGGAQDPSVAETFGKWDNTDIVTRIDILANTSTFKADSEVIVLGAD